MSEPTGSGSPATPIEQLIEAAHERNRRIAEHALAFLTHYRTLDAFQQAWYHHDLELQDGVAAEIGQDRYGYPLEISQAMDEAHKENNRRNAEWRALHPSAAPERPVKRKVKPKPKKDRKEG